MIKIVLRWPRRMIGMRMIEAQQVSPERSGPELRFAVIRRPHQKPTPGPFLSCVRQGDHSSDSAIASDQGAAAFMRIGLAAVRADRRVDVSGNREPQFSH